MDDEPKFIRQRRNLIISALVLLIVQTAGVDVQRASLAGLEFKIERPTVLVGWLWVFLAYFFVRYVQVYIEQSGKRALLSVTQNLMTGLIVKNAQRAAGVRAKTPGRHYYATGEKRGAREWGRWTVFVSEHAEDREGEKKTEKVTEHKVEVSGLALVCVRVRAVLYLLFVTPRGTEYFGPFIIAALPVVYELLRG